MKSLHYIVLLPVLIGCGREVPSDVQYYVNLFEQEYQGVTGKEIDVNINIVFATLPEKIAGRCLANGSVEIDEEYWKGIREVLREILVFHELGHCILNQGHRNNSIMQSTLLDPVAYKNNREYYIKELIGG